jgi:hypothetical protein
VPVFFLVIGMFTFFGAIISLYSEWLMFKRADWKPVDHVLVINKFYLAFLI